MKQEFLEREKDMIYEFLAEQDKDGYTVGHARNYTKIYVPSGLIKPNTLAMVRCGKPYLDGVLGDFVMNVEEA